MIVLKVNNKFIDVLSKHDCGLAHAIETYQMDKDRLSETFYGVKEYLETGATLCCPSHYFVFHILGEERGLICEDCKKCWEYVIKRLKEKGYLDESMEE